MKVCFFGESPNDTKAVAGLLTKQFPQLECVTFGGTIRGSHVENHRRASGALRVKLQEERNVKAIVFIRDLDAPKSNKQALAKRMDWFNRLNKEFAGTGIFLLHIQKSEALLLADIEVVNKHYGVKVPYGKNPEGEADPKQVLKNATLNGKRKYSENDTPDLFPLLNYKKLVEKVPYFDEFNQQMEKLLNTKGKKKN